MTSKSRKLNDAISELANTVPYGNLMLCTNPTELILSVIAHIKDIESRLAARDAKSCKTCRYSGDCVEQDLFGDRGCFTDEWQPQETT